MSDDESRENDNLGNCDGNEVGSIVGTDMNSKHITANDWKFTDYNWFLTTTKKLNEHYFQERVKWYRDFDRICWTGYINRSEKQLIAKNGNVQNPIFSFTIFVIKTEKIEHSTYPWFFYAISIL